MKQALFIFLCILLLALPSCVKESPEPVYTPQTVAPEDRELLYAEEINGITFSLYNDKTAEIVGLSEEITVSSLELPEAVEGYTVVAICDEAFCEANFTHVTLPSTLRSIGKRAFQRSLITEITLPDAVTSLGEEAFDNCFHLQKVTFGKGLKNVPVGCFFGCSALKSLSLPEGITSVEEEAFASLTALEELSLPSTLQKIGDFAFWNIGSAPLTIDVPAAVEAVGEDAFKSPYSHVLRYGGDNADVKNALGLS